jgi:hypothetical protein
MDFTNLVILFNSFVQLYMQLFLKGNPTLNALVASSLAIAVLAVSFSLFEPAVSHGQETFTVTQQITSEVSFLTSPGDVTMSGPIQGVTGGTSYGTSTFNVSTNDPDGYNVTIQFSTTTAMQGVGLSSDIDNYTPATGGVPDENFSVAAGDAEFAYSVVGVTTPSSVDSSFKVSGGVCGSGTNTAGKCWYNKANATVAETIVNATAPTAGTGATTSVVFRVGVGANPSPALETGFYIATATLTANVNP